MFASRGLELPVATVGTVVATLRQPTVGLRGGGHGTHQHHGVAARLDVAELRVLPSDAGEAGDEAPAELKGGIQHEARLRDEAGCGETLLQSGHR